MTSTPYLRSTRSPTETSPWITSAGSPASSRTRASPSSESTPEAASWSRSSGTPISERGQRTERPARPDPRGRGRRVGDREPELADQVDALGAPVEHRLGADVDDHAGDLGAVQLAADPGRRLEDEDVVTGSDQVTRGASGRRGPPPTTTTRLPTGQLSQTARRARAVATGAHRHGPGVSVSRRAGRSRCGGRPAAASCPRARRRAARAARSCGRRPRPRGRSCSRSGPGPRRG